MSVSSFVIVKVIFFCLFVYVPLLLQPSVVLYLLVQFWPLSLSRAERCVTERGARTGLLCVRYSKRTLPLAIDDLGDEVTML